MSKNIEIIFNRQTIREKKPHNDYTNNFKFSFVVSNEVFDIHQMGQKFELFYRGQPFAYYKKGAI